LKVLVKTHINLERVAASRILEVLGGGEAVPLPQGFAGLVLVDCQGDPDALASLIEREVPEVERALPVHAEARSEVEDICRAAVEAARGRLLGDETFAVRTTRRGRHDFTSIDVNVRVGARIQEEYGNPVNLENPDKIVWVEILGERAYISVTGGGVEYKKMWPGKPSVLRLLSRITVAQAPYTGDPRAARKVGERIGRAAQSLELREVVVTPFEPVEAESLAEFLRGLVDGVESRYRVQVKAYGRSVRKVRVLVQDLYQFVRDRRGEKMIVTSTRGVPVSQAATAISEMFVEGGRINVLIGAREGLPVGVFRFASLILDVAPGITLATDVALPSCITAIVNAALLGGQEAGETGEAT